VVRYLPSPLDAEVKGKDPKDQTKVIQLEPDPAKPFVGMAFKIVEDEFGQLTFTRIYQGTIEKGGTYYNQRTGKKERFGRIVKMHADKREEIDLAEAGDIIAIMGIDCASGDTYCSEQNFCTLENIFIAKPVIKMSINPISRDNSDRLGNSLLDGLDSGNERRTHGSHSGQDHP
jgi:elongation factor G